jgi:hypothetical protein
MQLGDKLKLLGTDLDLTRFEITEYPKIFKTVPDASCYLSQAMEEQLKIGWDHLFHRRLNNTWGNFFRTTYSKEEHW